MVRPCPRGATLILYAQDEVHAHGKPSQYDAAKIEQYSRSSDASQVRGEVWSEHDSRGGRRCSDSFPPDGKRAGQREEQVGLSPEQGSNGGGTVVVPTCLCRDAGADGVLSVPVVWPVYGTCNERIGSGIDVRSKRECTGRTGRGAA